MRLSEFHVPAYVENAYFWVFVFHSSRQEFHRYRLLGEEKVLGRPALALQFEPIEPIQDRINDWYGTAWVDREDGQLLKVEGKRPKEHAETRRLESDLAEARLKPRSYVPNYTVTTISTTFDVIKNGMRFRGEVVTERVGHVVRGGRRPSSHAERELLRVQQRYADYLFFSVLTDEEIRGILAPPRAAELPAKPR